MNKGRIRKAHHRPSQIILLTTTQPICDSVNYCTLTFQASRLTAAFHRSEPERIVAAKRRRQRLANFKTLQDQLLRPPTLAALEQTASNPGCPEYKAVDKQRQHCMSKTATNKRWSGAEEQTQKYRAQRAHALAAAAARAQSNKVWILNKILERMPRSRSHVDRCNLRSISTTSSEYPVNTQSE